MRVLGITGGWESVHEQKYDLHLAMRHDSAAVLVSEGAVVAAIEEERLNRIKHTNKAPFSAIRFCLDSHGMSLKDVDKIAIHGLEEYLNFQFKQYCLSRPTFEPFVSARTLFRQALSQEFESDIDDRRLCFVHHHLAHAVSAFAPSGFEKSLVLTIDAYGDGASGMILSGEGSRLHQISSLSESKSLGRFYLRVIRFLGYDLFDEYKVMGLAPYGAPCKYRPLFKRFYTLQPNGEYIINFNNLHELFNVASPRRIKGEFTQVYKDIAASLQEALEEIVLHVLKHYQKKTGHRNLCLAGGVAHNCTMNGRIYNSGMFENIFIQPASHDAGGALGSALAVYYQDRVRVKPSRMEHVYLGRDIGGDQSILDTLSEWRHFIDYTRVDNITERAAGLLARGCVIGWAQGRSEFGPRALGNRSILADPRPAENKSIINEMVKKREAYRPFAPSVLEEYVDEFFETPPGKQEFPFMVIVLNVREPKRKLLGAVTHVDGSARVQTVSKKTNHKYWELIDRFRELTGIPMLLNTSFNNNAEPIVDSVKDAIVCFLTTDLHYLAVGDYLVSKRAVDYTSFLNLVPSFPRCIRLLQTKRYSSANEMGIDYEIGNTYDDRRKTHISPEVGRILTDADGVKTLGMLLSDLGLANDKKKDIVTEIRELWSRRVITLSPNQVR